MVALDVRVEGVTRAAGDRLRRRLQRTMEAAGVGGAEVSLSLVGDEEMQALNREWRGEDHATDVLSFSQVEGEAVRLEEAPLLGDIVIAVATARRQAEGRGATLDEELLHLAVHGLAHLCGYDHATPREERVMFGWEAELRAQALSTGAVERVRRP